MGRKKKFIDKKNAATFVLMYRESEDSDAVAERVFVRADAGTNYVPGFSDDYDGGAGMREQEEEDEEEEEEEEEVVSEEGEEGDEGEEGEKERDPQKKGKTTADDMDSESRFCDAEEDKSMAASATSARKSSRRGAGMKAGSDVGSISGASTSTMAGMKGRMTRMWAPLDAIAARNMDAHRAGGRAPGSSRAPSVKGSEKATLMENIDEAASLWGGGGGQTGQGEVNRGLPDHVRKELLELGFPDDGYDYSRHLRVIGRGRPLSAFVPPELAAARIREDVKVGRRFREGRWLVTEMRWSDGSRP